MHSIFETAQGVADRATWPAKEPGNVMMAWRRGLPVVVNEEETTAILKMAISPRIAQFTFGAHPVRLLPHERCEWAYRSLAEMRGECVAGAAA